MKNLKSLCLGLSCFFLLSACEDVIELELDSTEPQLIIEAFLDASDQSATVLLSQSNDFYDNRSPAGVSGAEIYLQSEDGSIYTLSEQAVGSYKVQDISLAPEMLFTLSVEVEQKSYEAVTVVPYPVVLNGLEKIENTEYFYNIKFVLLCKRQ